MSTVESLGNLTVLPDSRLIQRSWIPSNSSTETKIKEMLTASLFHQTIPRDFGLLLNYPKQQTFMMEFTEETDGTRLALYTSSIPDSPIIPADYTNKVFIQADIAEQEGYFFSTITWEKIKIVPITSNSKYTAIVDKALRPMNQPPLSWWQSLTSLWHSPA